MGGRGGEGRERPGRRREGFVRAPLLAPAGAACSEKHRLLGCCAGRGPAGPRAGSLHPLDCASSPWEKGVPDVIRRKGKHWCLSVRPSLPRRASAPKKGPRLRRRSPTQRRRRARARRGRLPEALPVCRSGGAGGWMGAQLCWSSRSSQIKPGAASHTGAATGPNRASPGQKARQVLLTAPTATPTEPLQKSSSNKPGTARRSAALRGPLPQAQPQAVTSWWHTPPAASSRWGPRPPPHSC